MHFRLFVLFCTLTSLGAQAQTSLAHDYTPFPTYSDDSHWLIGYLDRQIDNLAKQIKDQYHEQFGEGIGNHSVP